MLIKCDIWVFFENLLRKFNFHWNPTRITGTLYEDQYTFFIISHSVLLRMRIVSDRSCRENQNTYFMFSNFFPANRAVYQITLKIIVEPSRPQMTTWRMRIACWITKATDIHSECVVLNAFPLQQWLHERASIPYTTLPVLLLLSLAAEHSYLHVV